MVDKPVHSISFAEATHHSLICRDVCTSAMSGDDNEAFTKHKGRNYEGAADQQSGRVNQLRLEDISLVYRNMITVQPSRSTCIVTKQHACDVFPLYAINDIMVMRLSALIRFNV
jgi:hypothetical protein